MKIKSLFFALGVLVIFWVGFPLLFVLLNNWLGLPIYIFGMFRLIGLFLIVGGLVIALVASMTFMKFGKGTPAITEPPKKLVIRGLYRRTRNPIYVAHVMIFLGLFILLGYVMLLVCTIVGVVGLHLYIVKYEEPVLKKRYGKDYGNYMKRVPRWILI